MGVSVHLDYVLLVPVAEDMTVDVEWGQDDLNIMSFAATGIGHPAVMSLAPNWEGISEPAIFQDDAGGWALGYPWPERPHPRLRGRRPRRALSPGGPGRGAPQGPAPQPSLVRCSRAPSQVRTAPRAVHRNSLARYRALRRVPMPGCFLLREGGSPPSRALPPIPLASGPPRRNGLQRRLQPARGPQVRKARRATCPDGATAWNAGLRPARGPEARKARRATRPDGATAWNAGFSRHEARRRPAKRVGLPARMAHRLGTPASAGTAGRRPAKRVGLPARMAHRLGTPASAGTAGRRPAKRVGLPARMARGGLERRSLQPAFTPRAVARWLFPTPGGARRANAQVASSSTFARSIRG